MARYNRYGKRIDKPKIRPVAVIEAELADFNKRKQQYEAWTKRNNLFHRNLRDRVGSEMNELHNLKNSKSSYRRRLGLFQTEELKPMVEVRIKKLQSRIDSTEKQLLLEIPELEFPKDKYFNPLQGLHCEDELKKAKAIKRQKDKQLQLKAKAARTDSKSRILAQSTKLKLQRDHMCPYCGNDLGEEPHADHIYPVSKGGLSTERNMVYVCAQCNLRKRDMTLSVFVRRYNLDRDKVEEKLLELGKDI